MPNIDPSIVVHEIPTYPNAKPVQQRLHPVHPRKETAIKGEVEKLLKDGFIYPIPLTYWVSNIVSVTKKQGTIQVCVDYCDLNHVCPKDNYPTPFIDQIIDECVGSEIFSFMDSFSGYNQISIASVDQDKTAFIYSWGLLRIKISLSALIMLGQLFKERCHMFSMTLKTSFNLIWMIFLLIHISAMTIPTIFNNFFFVVDTTTFS